MPTIDELYVDGYRIVCMWCHAAFLEDPGEMCPRCSSKQMGHLEQDEEGAFIKEMKEAILGEG